MKWIKLTFYFLGGLYFAIGLIFLTAVMAIWGTILEARSDSHLYAAQYTYGNPVFALLLSLFFINILFSAILRWPFKPKHIPFLITHLGLLMIIAGCLAKNWYGVQGHLYLSEGSGNNTILIPHTYAIHLEKKNSLEKINIPISNAISRFNNLQLKILRYIPHTSERLETWIKGNHAYIARPPINSCPELVSAHAYDYHTASVNGDHSDQNQ